MANPGYPFQDRYFYNFKWSKVITLYLIEELLNEKHLGHWHWDKSNTLAMLFVRNRVNARFDKNFEFHEVSARVRSLRSRFRVFDQMISTEAVEWDRENNSVHASIHIWDEWIQRYPLAMAYIYNGDALYDVLKALFAPPKDMDPGNASGSGGDIINISSGDKCESDNENDEVIQISDDEPQN